MNGAAFQDYSGSQFVPRNVKAIMKSGNDRVGIFVGVNKNVTANMGKGADLFTINGQGNTLPVAGNLKVNTGSTEGLLVDQVFILDTAVVGSANVKGGNGIQQATVNNVSVGKTFSVNLGGGNSDSLSVTNSLFSGSVKLNGGSGSGDTLNWAGTNPPSKGFEILN